MAAIGGGNMSWEETGLEAEDETWLVVVNDEEQYSLWWQDRTLPEGWRAVGKSGSRKECLDYIDEVWVDMTPLSVRRRPAEEEAIRQHRET